MAQLLLYNLIPLLVLLTGHGSCSTSSAARGGGSKKCSLDVHSKSFISPGVVTQPGEARITDLRVEFPKGHIGIKGMWGEVVDELGTPVPLSEVYVHHWIMSLYQVKSGAPAIVIPGSSGNVPYLTQFFGGAAETRNPYPFADEYATELGRPDSTPEGYENVWYLQLHTIFTEGTVDPFKCGECLCELYSNVTRDISNIPGYIGGLFCCDEGAKCKLIDGYQPAKKTLHFKYTVTWVDWDDGCLIPSRLYLYDLTDPLHADNGRQGEHDVMQCEDPLNEEACVDFLVKEFVFPKSGKIVTMTAHQHIGGLGFSMHGKDGAQACHSHSRYGNGSREVAGDEDGYLVQMSFCKDYGRVEKNEKLRFVSKYSSVKQHTGVMSVATLQIALDEDVVQRRPELAQQMPRKAMYK